MLVVFMIIFGIVGVSMLVASAESWEHELSYIIIGLVLCFMSLVIFIFRLCQWIYRLSKDRGHTSRSYNSCRFGRC